MQPTNPQDSAPQPQPVPQPPMPSPVPPVPVPPSQPPIVPGTPQTYIPGQPQTFVPGQPASTYVQPGSPPVAPTIAGVNPYATGQAVPQAQPQLQTHSMPPVPSFKKHKLLIVGVAVVVLLAAAGVGAWWFMNSNSAQNPGTTTTTTTTDGKLNLSNLIDRNTSIKAQDIKAKLNQQVDLSDGRSYMVTKVERKATVDIDGLKLNSGQEFMLVHVVVGNKKKTGEVYVIPGDFKLKNSGGGIQRNEYVAKGDLEGAFESQNLAPAKQMTGILLFKVDVAEAVSLVTDDTYTNLTTKEEIAIKSEVALQ